MLASRASAEKVLAEELVRRFTLEYLESEPETCVESEGESPQTFPLPEGAVEHLAETAERLGVSKGSVCRAAVDAGLGLSTALAFPDRAGALEKMGFAEEDLVFQVAEDRPMQLHPGFQAVIAEQLQFDGDIPELRTAAMPRGAEPAVPVQTKALNPVMVGAQLQEARSTVAGELSAPGAVSAYREGHKAPVLPATSDTSIVSMSPRDMAKAAFKALTSSQGRRSFAPAIQAALVRALEADGVRVQAGALSRPSHTHVWDSFLPSGPDDFNPKFSYADAAVAAFRAKVLSVWDRKSKVCLQVEPYAKVAKRRFGWVVGFILDTSSDL